MSDTSASPPPTGPDFSGIDSRAKAEEMFNRGDLAKLYLMPLEFGGADNRLNTLYVPDWVVDVKAGIDTNVIRPLAAEGKINHYKAMPKYQQGSVIPISIEIIASDPGEFRTTINIWGEALAEQAAAG